MGVVCRMMLGAADMLRACNRWRVVHCSLVDGASGIVCGGSAGWAPTVHVCIVAQDVADSVACSAAVRVKPLCGTYRNVV